MDQIITLLTPTTLADYMTYVIFFVGIVVMFTMPEKNNLPLNLILVVLFCCVIELLRGDGGELFTASFGNNFGFDNLGFGTMMIHIMMALLPFLAAALIRVRGRKQRRIAMPLSIVLGFLGVVFTIGTFMQPGTFY